MPLLKEVTDPQEVRKKRNPLRIVTWALAAVILIVIWFFTN